METKQYKLTGHFILDKNHEIEVIWLEDSLTKDAEDGTKQPMGVDDVALAYRKLLLKHKLEGNPFTTESINGSVVCIDITAVKAIELFIDIVDNPPSGEVHHGRV